MAQSTKQRSAPPLFGERPVRGMRRGAGPCRYMVSRQFAAMLQMLNDGNLVIDRKEGEWTKQTCGQMDVISQFTITCLDLQVGGGWGPCTL